MIRHSIASLALLLLLGGVVGCATSPAPHDASVHSAAASEPVAPGEPLASAALDVTTLPLEAEIPLDPRLREGTLENGMRFVIRQAPRPPQRAQLWLVVDAGSVLENERQLGLAHFLEHMAFNGTERFEKQEIVEYLESIGMRFGPDLNAYTTMDETVYMLQVPTEDEIVERALEILAQWAGSIALDPEEVDRERGVVIEEWRLSRGAGARLMDRQLPILMEGSLYAERLPIGEKEIIETAPVEELRTFYETWYQPENMAVVAVGDFDVDDIESRIRKHFAGLEGEGELPERPELTAKPHSRTLVSIEDDPETTGITVGVHSKTAPPSEGRLVDYRDSLVESLFFSVLNDRMGEVAREADPPYVFAGVSAGRFARHVAFNSLGARVTEDGIAKGLEAALLEVERIRQHGVTPSELDRAKQNLLRGYERAAKEVDNETSSGLAAELTRHLLEGESVPGIAAELALARRFLPEIDVAEVNARAADWMDDEHRVVLVSAPRGAEIALPSEDELRAVLASTKTAALDPWVDETPEGPLVAEAPEPGSIVEERFVESVGVTEWTLSNGVKVLLKPTDFREDQILVSGWSPGGTSLVATEDLASAMFLGSIVAESGLGSFDREELEKVLTGTQVQVGLGVGQLEETVSGGGSRDDLETLFQLLWLRFQEPRFDRDAWDRLAARFQALIAHRERDPSYVFGRKLGDVLTQESPRRPDFDEETLAEVDVDVAEKIYRDRFADASDFTLAFVGSFDVDELRPLVETWVGSLPVVEREETWVDDGVHPPDGAVSFTVEKGLEPKSQVRLILHGDAAWSREEQHLLGSLAAALNIELRKVLREDLGGTYGVSVSSNLWSRPREEYSLSVSFGCDPHRLDELIGEMRATLERARTEGFDESTIAKVKESQRRSRETALEENGSWLGWLQTYWSLGLDPALILEYDELVDGLTAEELQAAAQHYLVEERAVQGVLVPEVDASSEAAEG